MKFVILMIDKMGTQMDTMFKNTITFKTYLTNDNETKDTWHEDRNEK